LADILLKLSRGDPGHAVALMLHEATTIGIFCPKRNYKPIIPKGIKWLRELTVAYACLGTFDLICPHFLRALSFEAAHF
jgi:hypothetical protein